MIRILSKEDYFNCDIDVDPLICGWDNVNSDVYLPIEIRKEIQELSFGKYANGLQRFYRWCWNHMPQRCEETGVPLNNYAAIFISHILSRGAHPEMTFDPRNINILSAVAHARWENGDRKDMRIYSKNTSVIQLLKNEYRSKICKL